MADLTPEQQAAVDAAVAERLAAETAGLKTNQKQLLDEKKALAAKLAAFEGIDPEKARTALTEREKLERERQEAAGNFKGLEEQLVKKFDGEKATWGTREKTLLSALDEHLLDAAAIAELAKHSDTPGLLLPHLRRQMKLVEENGKFAARIVDESGTVRIGKGQGSTPMTVAEIVEEMKGNKEYAAAFRGTGSSGGGATRSTGGASGGQRTIASTNSPDFLANLKDIAGGKTTVGS